jgi:hypothetical protein
MSEKGETRALIIHEGTLVPLKIVWVILGVCLVAGGLIAKVSGVSQEFESHKAEVGKKFAEITEDEKQIYKTYATILERLGTIEGKLDSH